MTKTSSSAILRPDEEMESTSTQSFRHGGRIHYTADEVAVRVDLPHHVFVHLKETFHVLGQEFWQNAARG